MTLKVLEDNKSSQETVSLKKVPFYFLRHGQTDWNLEKRIMGQKDIPLNSKGEQQAYNVTEILKKLGITTIYHSPLSRAVKTAEIINAVLKVPILSLDGLKEKNSGELEGFSYKEGEEKRQNILDEWYGKSIPVSAESWDEFNFRTIKAINQCLAKGEEETALVIAHGGTYRSICSALQIEINEIEN